MTSPSSLYSPVCAVWSHRDWLLAPGSHRSSREKCVLPSWLASGFWRLLAPQVHSLVQWLVEVWRRRKRKDTHALVHIEWLLIETAESIPAVTPAAALSGLPPFFHSSIPPLHLPAAFILFLILLIIMICIQQKRLIQAGIRLSARAGRWACVLGGFWVVWLLRTYNNKDYERLISEIWKTNLTQIYVMWLLRLCVCLMTWPHVCVFAGSVCREIGSMMIIF